MEAEINQEPILSMIHSSIDRSSRTLYLIGDIDEESTHRFILGLNLLSQTEGNIRIILSSSGGIEQCGYAIYDAIRNAKNSIIIEGYGQVSSMAAVVFQGADVRKLAPNCEYLIHNGFVSGSPEEIQQDFVVKLANQIKLNSKRYYQILFDNSDLEWEQIEEYCKEEKIFTSKEAVDAGLADQVIKPVKKAVRKKRKKGK